MVPLTGYHESLVGTNRVDITHVFLVTKLKMIKTSS